MNQGKCKRNLLGINNLMASIVICFSLINGALGIDGISYATSACVFILFLCGIVKGEARVYIDLFCVILYILIVFVVSFFVVEDTYYTMYYFMHFMGFGTISLLVGRQRIVIEQVIKYVERIGLVCLIVFVMRGFEQYDASLQMGISYSFLPVLCVSLIDLIHVRTKSILAIVNVVGISSCYINIAPRGVLLNVFITVILYVFITFGKHKSRSFQYVFRIIAISVIIVAVILLYNYFGTILLWLTEIFYEVTGIKIYALEKAAFLFNSGDFSNGRDSLIDLAKELTRENYILGCGIGHYEVLQGSGGYVHNIFYQAICEAGVFFTIPLIVLFFVLIKYLVHIDRSKEKLSMPFFLMLFTNGFVTLFYSSVYWKLLLFWFLIGYIINKQSCNSMYVSLKNKSRRNNFMKGKENEISG